MIRHLYIRNFTIIEELDIDLFPGFSVITGETGAGKSIVLGAIGLLKGQRADSKMIRSGADRCIVEAHFDLTRYDDMQSFFTDNDIDYDAADCIVRREITAAGKSRASTPTPPSPGVSMTSSSRCRQSVAVSALPPAATSSSAPRSMTSKLRPMTGVGTDIT